MEPFSLVIFILGAVASEIIGSRSDKFLSTVMHTVAERLRGDGQPVNYDLQRAVNKAHLQATLEICEKCRKTCSLPGDRVWLGKVHNDILKNMDQLPDADYMPPTIEAEEQIKLLLQPKNTEVQLCMNDLRKTLQDGLLSKLKKKYGEPIACFKEKIQPDEMVSNDTVVVHTDWFNLFCAYFAGELKTNEDLSQQLENLVVDCEPLTLQAFQEQFEKLGTGIVEQIEKMRGYLILLSDEQDEGFERVQEQLDVIIPQLRSLSEILEQQEAVQNALQLILREARRRPLYEQYTGIEIADRVEQLCHEHTIHFVGRDEKLRELDNFISDNDSGIKIVTANAGFGKSALLANWVEMRKFNRGFIAHHFFSQRFEVTRSTRNACLNLLRQIYIYYELTDELLPNDENRLRDMLIGILKERRTHDDEPLVIVIDALDEAKDIFPPPFPIKLPDGMFVIVSARADEFEEPEYLRNWTDGAGRIPLTRLPRSAIASWLQRAGDGELATFAEDEHFITQLDGKTQGFPLYLHYLIDEMMQTAKARQDVHAVLKRSPHDFGAYVCEQLELLAKEMQQQHEVQKLFTLLSVARGPLSEDDVLDLTKLTCVDLKALPWRVTRWFTIQILHSNQTMYAFTNPLLAKEFKKSLKKQAHQALDKLVNYCIHWQDHKRPYALRHYAEHLYDGDQWKELFALVKNEAFTSAQVKILPDEPDLPLKTVQTALQCAVEKDDAEAMAEFLLLHARRLLQTRAQESPLEALREGNLQCAWELADLYDIRSCTHWHLLIAWELRDASKLKEARETLERLLKKNLLRLTGVDLSDWSEDCAAYELAHLSDVSKDAFTALQKQLLGNRHRNSLCQNLIHCSHLDAARKTAQDIWNASDRLEILILIALAEAEAGTMEEARKTFVTTHEAAQEIRNASDRLKALSVIAQAEAQAGLTDEARKTFATANDAAQEIRIASDRLKALNVIARAEFQAGLMDEALKTIVVSNETEKYILNDSNWLKEIDVLFQSVIVLEKAQAGEFDAAHKTAQDIWNASDRSKALSVIAQAEAQAGKFDAAHKTAQEIRIASDRSKALSVIAQAEAQASLTDEARTTFAAANDAAQEIRIASDRPKALSVIAQAEAQAGLTDETRKNLADAHETVKYTWNDLDWLAQSIIALTEAQVEAQAGEFDAAHKTAQKIRIASDRSKALSVIAQAEAQVEAQVEAQAGEFNAAHKTAQEIRIASDRPKALSVIAQAEAQAGLTDEARKTLASANDAAQEIRIASDRPKALSVIALVEAQVEAQAGEFDAAHETAQEIRITSYRLKALSAIAQAEVQAGLTDEARKTFAVAHETAQEIRITSYRLKALSAIAQAEAQAGLTDEARKTFAVAHETVKYILNDFDRSKALSVIAQAEAQAGLTDEARKTFAAANDAAQENRIASDRSKALSAIAQAEAQAGLTDEARKTLASANDAAQENRIASDRSKALSVIALVEAQVEAQAGEFDAAHETAQEIRITSYRLKALSAIAQAEAQAGLTDEARKTLAAANEATKELESTWPWSKAQALSTIAQVEAEVGLGTQAIATAKTILESQEEHFPKVAESFVKIGDREHFKQLLIPCAYYLSAAYRMSGLLARLYPEQAAAVARIVCEFTQD